MAIDTTNNNNIVYEFLTEQRFRLGRRLIIIAMIIGCSFGQVFLMFGQRIEALGYGAYIIGIGLALLYAMLIYCNLNYLVPRLLLRGKYVEYFTMLIVGTTAILLCVRVFDKYPIICTYKIIKSFNPISFIDILSSLVIAAICITSSLIPTLIRQWIIDSRNISNLENRQLKNTIDEFKSRIDIELLYNIIEKASEIVKTDSNKTSVIIISLCELLRYQLYDCNREKLFLHADIEFTRNYLSLVEMVSTSFSYSISVTGNTNLFVPPFKLFSLIQESVSKKPEMLNIYYTIDSTEIELRCETKSGNSYETEYMRLKIKV